MVGAQPAGLRAIWQQVRTPAARYAEALTWMDEGNLAQAADVIESIPLEHDLRAPEMLERQRMLDLIAYMEPIRFRAATMHNLLLARSPTSKRCEAMPMTDLRPGSAICSASTMTFAGRP